MSCYRAIKWICIGLAACVLATTGCKSQQVTKQKAPLTMDKAFELATAEMTKNGGVNMDHFNVSVRHSVEGWHFLFTPVPQEVGGYYSVSVLRDGSVNSLPAL